MIPILSIPDPNPVAAELIQQIQFFGFRGARVDVHPDDHEVVTAQIRSYAAVPDFFVIYLLAGGTMQRSDGKPWEPEDLLQHVRDVCTKLRDLGLGARDLALEIGNEPDLAHKRWKRNPEELGKLYKEAVGIVKSFSATWRCLSPSISNLDADSLDYLDRMELQCGSEIAFHRYPNGKDFWNAQRGFRTREDEVFELKRIAKGAPLWHTEGGWAEENGDHKLTELEVADRMADEYRFWRDNGVMAWTAYQINSGHIYAGDDTDTKRLKTYGARRADETWKPWPAAVKEAIG